MKKFIVLIICAFITISANAQDPQLFENTWYLEELVIDTEVISLPSNEEVSNIPLFFNESGSTFVFETAVCNLLFGELSFNNPTFSFIGDLGATAANCQNPSNTPFENDYFNFYEEYVVSPFTYEITTTGTGDKKSLLITNANGDTALYGEETLAIKDFEKQILTLFPNPAGEVLNISASNANLKNISIFNVQGQEMMTLEFQQNELTFDVTSLQTGVYFLKAESDTGQHFTAKFVKQ